MSSAPALQPPVMLRQVAALSSDLRELLPPFAEQLAASLPALAAAGARKVYLVGCGDSHCAALAAELAFHTLGGVSCQALPALRFSEYAAAALALDAGPCWVVGISASGGTPAVVRAVQQARQHGAFTLAVTAQAHSPLAEAADARLLVTIPNNERSPGIRSYQASLLGLILLAVELGVLRGCYTPEQALSLRRELQALVEPIASITSAWQAPCEELASALVGDLTQDPRVILLGSGPHYGTALFGAAKLVEAAGICALGQDVEEWWHIERFAYPLDMLSFVLSPGGRSHWRAVEIAGAARQRGRRVVGVSPPGALSLAPVAWRALTVPCEVREAFSPLVYHVFAGYLGAYTALKLGRGLFQAPAAPGAPASTEA